MFRAMAQYQAKLERKQALLGRFVDIGAELYAMSAACVRAQSLRDGPNGKEAVQLADVFCRRSRLRVNDLFRHLFRNQDDATYRLAQGVLKGDYAWLEEGTVRSLPDRIEAPQPDRVRHSLARESRILR
jgi:hypothetical protein